MAQRMTFGLFSGATSQRIEFVRMKGPQGTFFILFKHSFKHKVLYKTCFQFEDLG